MKKISNATEMFEISTSLCCKVRRIAILNGEIVRILDTGCGGFGFYLIRDDVDMKLFEDTEAILLGEEILYWKYNNNYNHKWYGVNYIQKKGITDFNEECYNEIRLIAKHNPEELKNLYELLKEGKMKEYVKEVQKDLLKALDF